jgi:DNA-binding FadR family transcriptional regulator
MAVIRNRSTRTRSAVFAPINNLGRAVRVEQRLAQAIWSGLLLDGEKLPSESELAAMLGVATVTAREALISLRAQGLVTTIRGRGGGSFVTRPNRSVDENLRNRIASMTRVELADRGVHYATVLSGCAELAAERANADEIDELLSIIPEVDGDATEAVTADSWRHADTELNLAIAALSHSAHLTRNVIRLEMEFGSLLRIPFANRDLWPEVRRDQVELIEAIRDHDANTARQRMRIRVRKAVGQLADLHAQYRSLT